MPDRVETVETECWAVVEGTLPDWRDPAVMRGMKIVSLRKRRPESVGANQHAVRVVISMPDTAFVPTARAEVHF